MRYFILSVFLLRLSCERPVPPPRPTSPPATTIPASFSTFSIAGNSCTFPRAHLLAEVAGDRLLIQLYSEGASVDGSHDGFYFEFPIDTSDPSRLDDQSWQYSTHSAERSDELRCSITVNNGANLLQPKDVTITLHTLSPNATEVRITGFFNVFKTLDNSPATSILPIQATIQAVTTHD